MNIIIIRNKLQHYNKKISMIEELNTKILLYSFNKNTTQNPYDDILNAPDCIKDIQFDIVYDYIFKSIFKANYGYFASTIDVENKLRQLTSVDYTNFLYFTHPQNSTESLIYSFLRHLRNSVAHGLFNNIDNAEYRLDQYPDKRITLGMRRSNAENMNEKYYKFLDLIVSDEFNDISDILLIDENFSKLDDQVIFDDFNLISMKYDSNRIFHLIPDIKIQKNVAEFIYSFILYLEKNRIDFKDGILYFSGVTRNLKLNTLLNTCILLIKSKTIEEVLSVNQIKEFFDYTTILFKNNLSDIKAK